MDDSLGIRAEDAPCRSFGHLDSRRLVCSALKREDASFPRDAPRELETACFLFIKLKTAAIPFTSELAWSSA